VLDVTVLLVDDPNPSQDVSIPKFMIEVLEVPVLAPLLVSPG
jgi:hypothetical protein